jgi:hypothetical protein
MSKARNDGSDGRGFLGRVFGTGQTEVLKEALVDAEERSNAMKRELERFVRERDAGIRALEKARETSEAQARTNQRLLATREALTHDLEATTRDLQELRSQLQTASKKLRKQDAELRQARTKRNRAVADAKSLARGLSDLKDQLDDVGRQLDERRREQIATLELLHWLGAAVAAFFNLHFGPRQDFAWRLWCEQLQVDRWVTAQGHFTEALERALLPLGVALVRQTDGAWLLRAGTEPTRCNWTCQLVMGLLSQATAERWRVETAEAGNRVVPPARSKD